MKPSYHSTVSANQLETPSDQLISGDKPFDTGPPPENNLSFFGDLKAGVSQHLSDLVMPIVSRFARDHVGGETVDEAMAVARRLGGQGMPCTLGFWDSSAYSERSVTDIYLASVSSLAGSGVDGYVSIKPPALHFSAGMAVELALAAKSSGVRLHCDSHGPEAASASNGMLQAMLDEAGPQYLGTTIPGRWSRSLEDADWAIERCLNVRVVKGQWPDPKDPHADLRAGFLEVIQRLAGRARHVAVATHDMPLASEAIEMLRAAGTSCELEQIFGLASRQALQWAQENKVGVRKYIPFGKGYIPNAVRLLKRNPRLAWIIAKKIARPGAD